MTEREEYKGYWFLPDNPEDKIAGTLTYIPNEKISLELIGGFNNERDAIFTFIKKKNESVLYGIISTGKQVTLLNCISSGSFNTTCSFPIIRYSCQYVIIGKHIKSLDEKCRYKAQVFFSELTIWCYPGAINNTIKQEEDNKSTEVIYSFPLYKENDGIINSTSIDDNTNLLLRKGVDCDSSCFNISSKIEQCTYLEIKKKQSSSIADFLFDIMMYEEFLSLATLSTVICSDITFYEEDLYELADEEKQDYPIKILYKQYEKPSTKKITPLGLLFDFNKIKDSYSEIIRKWYVDSEDISPIRSHLVESVKNKSLFTSIDFLIVIQAIEGFYSRFRKDKECLTKILTNLISEFGDVDKIRNSEIDINAAVDSRHYYSHFMNPSKKPHTVDGVELFNLTKELRKLLICCILNFIGLTNQQINELLNGSNNYLVE